MRAFIFTIINLLVLLNSGCIIQFIPETEEKQKLLVVEGLITDQNRTNKIRITYSLPVGDVLTDQPVKGCTVIITEEKGKAYNLREKSPGIYITDSTQFRGQVNRKYSLFIQTGTATYKTGFVEMKPVPPIDSVYFRKVTITEKTESRLPVEGCQIFVGTHDPSGQCLYYRWDFRETWEFRLPYSVANRICWRSANSDKIFIKNISIYNQASVTDFPLQYITNATDRLEVRYSIIVNQYSLNEDEFSYWEKVKNVSESVGGLYDITPMSILGNIYRVEDPGEPVLGYFSVSAVASERIFIDNDFMGLPNFYAYCPTDTVWGPSTVPISGLGVSRWVIDDRTTSEMPPYRIITQYKQCADCTVRGTTVKPSFWDDKGSK